MSTTKIDKTSADADIHVNRLDNTSLNFNFVDSDGVPEDLTGLTYKLFIIDAITLATILSSDYTITTPTSGIIEANLTDANWESLGSEKDQYRYYLLETETSSSNDITVSAGFFNINNRGVK